MSMKENAAPQILLVEDDHDYWDIARRAFGNVGVAESLRIVSSGEEALEFLRRCDATDSSGAPRRPCFVLMDLKMPGMGGIEALRVMKQDPDLRIIPVVVFSTSAKPSDVYACYETGANGFVEKPVEFVEYVRTVERLCDYWLRLVVLPN